MDYLQEIRSTIKTNGLMGDDLLRRMEIKGPSQLLTLEDVKKAFDRLDPYLGEEKCLRMAKSFFILPEENEIEANRIIDALEIDRRGNVCKYSFRRKFPCFANFLKFRTC